MPDRYDLRRGVIHRAYAEDIYPTMEPGSVRLVVSDGPYAMRKAEWDRMSLDDLPAWYAPHIEAWGRLCAPDATVYLWGSDESEGRLRGAMRAAGWVFRCSIVWDKRTSPRVIAGERATAWPDITERCGMWTRGEPPFDNSGRLTSVWPLASTQYASEKIRHPSEMLRAAHGLEWAAPLHVSQKPLTFSDRMIRASTRPGELVLEPFGGTCRVAVACERMPEPEARRYICIEPDQDGRDYIAAVLPSLRLELPAEDKDGQIGLFACPSTEA